ncbi:MAG: hypothetical protein ACTSRG_15105 [Candidatus Helarchaeota archaeon]
MSNVDPSEIISGKGTIKHLKIEGGFYGIIGEDGSKYYPSNLPDEFKKEGLRVIFRVKKRSVVSFQMWGTNVEIVTIENAK